MSDENIRALERELARSRPDLMIVDRGIFERLRERASKAPFQPGDLVRVEETGELAGRYSSEPWTARIVRPTPSESNLIPGWRATEEPARNIRCGARARLEIDASGPWISEDHDKITLLDPAKPSGLMPGGSS